MRLLKSLLVAASAIASCNALPGALHKRDITTQQLDTFTFWVQYAAASYCEPNYAGKAGHKITCWAQNCPAVEASDATIITDFSNTTPTDTSGYLAVDHTHRAIILAFRGSYSIRSWLADFTFVYTDPNLCSGCEAELGFWSSWTNVRKAITPTLNNTVSQYPDYELVIVGHSLGAAIATLAAANIRETDGLNATLYAYASPRVANPKLAEFITNQNKGANYRFAHTDDPVPRVPLEVMGYKHISPEYWISSGNNQSVSTQDVVVFQDGDDKRGDVGFPNLLDFEAHLWYFEAWEVDACKGEGLPWKRSN
ncbi:hypothetical protein CBS11852_8952 [Aspergillus niger]|nr:hypothetical protein CBS11852_8952 [Aspergillus niger]